jgi:hypothetical protein
MNPLYSLLAIAGLTLVHLFSAELPLFGREPRSRWLSVAGGVPVAFVFLNLLPAIAHDQAQLGAGLALLPDHLYLLALVGLLTFYAVERVVRQRAGRRAPETHASTDAVFWASVGSFAGMNAIIGYLLIQQERPLRNLVLFAGAMALKFMVDDYGLHKDHHRAYDRRGRLIIVGALALGWVVGLLATVPAFAIAALRAFLAGGILLNMLKEELFGAQEGRVWAFTLGALGYAVLLLLL